MTEEQLEKIARRAAEIVSDSNPYDPHTMYQAIKLELAKELGEGTIKQATWIIVNGIRALVAMALMAFAAWAFELKTWVEHLSRIFR